MLSSCWGRVFSFVGGAVGRLLTLADVSTVDLCLAELPSRYGFCVFGVAPIQGCEVEMGIMCVILCVVAYNVLEACIVTRTKWRDGEVWIA